MSHSHITPARKSSGPPLYYYAPAVFYLVFSLTPLLMFGENYAMVRIIDDAFYYIVIARNIVEVGESAFFSGELTNGYHPLWLLYLTAGGRLLGFSLVAMKGLEIFSIFIGLVVFIRFFRFKSLIEASFYSLTIIFLLLSFAMVAMESSLIFPTLAFFFASMLSDEPFIKKHRAVLLFVSAALVIGTRLDAAAFVLPILAVARVNTRQKLGVFLALLVSGLIYLAINLWLFGQAFPVSSAIKSWGGLQWNTLYAGQIINAFREFSFASLNPNSAPFLFAGISLVLVLILKKTNKAPVVAAILLAALVGFILFEAKLLYASSWGVWRWYAYSQLVFALPVIWLLVGKLNRRLGQLVMIPLSLLMFYPFSSSVLSDIRLGGYIGLTAKFLEIHEPLLAERTIAMGDRAGQAGYLYKGNVFQLEGIVSSPAYVEVLKKGGDLRPYLCARGIEVIVDYEIPLGDYSEIDLEIFDPNLTTAKAASLRVFASEEIAQYADPQIWGVSGIQNSTIYAWQLSCP